MPEANLIIYEEDYQRLNSCLARLCQESRGRAVFLIDKSGQLIASHGEVGNLDTMSLASLTAGNIAATGGLAKLLGEEEFSILFHEGERDNLHISIVAQRVILLVLFDHRSSLGLVRLRVKRGSEELAQIFADVARRSERETGVDEAVQAQLAEISDEDIDNLFKS